MVDTIKSSQDNVELCVAANDLGQYVKYVVNGRKRLDEFEGKRSLMELLTHDDKDVRYQALLAVQYIVLIIENLCNNGDFTNKT